MFDIHEALKENNAQWEQVMFLLSKCPERDNYKYIANTVYLCQLRNNLLEKNNAGNIQSKT